MFVEAYRHAAARLRAGDGTVRFPEERLRSGGQGEVYPRRRLNERMLDWMESIDVEPSDPPEPVEIPESEPPPKGDSLLEELTLLVLYFASWEEKERSGHTVRAWKGHDFEVLDRLHDKGPHSPQPAVERPRRRSEGASGQLTLRSKRVPEDA